MEFWVKLKENWEITSSEGEEVIKTNIYLSQAREEFETKVNSKMDIVQKGYFEDEIFGNSGSVPPRVGDTTTYTIMWQAKNFYNNVNSVTVKAKLSKNVKLTGEIFPEDEELKFTFDSGSREIIWRIGDLQVGKGVLNSVPNIAFQVAFSPDSSQIGQTPDIIGQAEIIGQDDWTKEILTFSTNSIDTSLLDDPTVENGVVQ